MTAQMETWKGEVWLGLPPQLPGVSTRLCEQDQNPPAPPTSSR